jgi:hypothetical protein
LVGLAQFQMMARPGQKGTFRYLWLSVPISNPLTMKFVAAIFAIGLSQVVSAAPAAQQLSMIAPYGLLWVVPSQDYRSS